MSKIGILHPGEMGISVAATAINSGNQVYWASQGRSTRSRSRAEQQGLIETHLVSQLCNTCEIIISVCPPHAAEETAQLVMDCTFKGLYLDANAIAPKRAVDLGQRMEAAGIRFIDGGIIGGPAWTPGETWLFLSGEDAADVATCFSKGPLETRVIGDSIGKASALKMCYAAYSKGTTALLAAILASAESLGVLGELLEQWNQDEAGFSNRIGQRVQRVTAKAWRFEGEMKEIATTFRDAGMPGEFHEAASEVFRRIAGFKDATSTPPLDDVIRVLLNR